MVLREAGLIQDRRDGWNVFYRVAEPRIFAIIAAVEQIIPPRIIGSEPSRGCLLMPEMQRG